jgi:lipid-A-disaccharide synthase
VVRSDHKKILVIAGEASGDLHGGRVIENLLRLDPQIRVYAVGGEALRQAGAQILVDSSELAVVGITEVIGRMGKIIRRFFELKGFIKKTGLSLLILIDFPDFNLAVANVARKVGIPILYYISPQVWAWRPGRVRKIARRIDKMAVILPFEVPIYERAGVSVEFVGHPLLDSIPCQGPENLPPINKERGTPQIVLLPGSRTHEVQSLLPEMLEACSILFKKYPKARFTIAAASTIRIEDLEAMVRSSPVETRLVQGQTYRAIHEADLAIVASGTATLETALLGKPMVILYRVSPISYWVGRALVNVQCIGLVNIVAGKRIIPELLQDEACGKRIAEEALRILEDEAYRQSMIRELQEVGRRLGSPGASERVARLAVAMMRSPSAFPACHGSAAGWPKGAG